MNELTRNLIMNSAFKRTVRKIAGATDSLDRTDKPDKPDRSSGAAFCRRLTQVAVISVDTAGMEVTFSGQKGIWVQWP
jgi:hypothetical protein